MHPYTYIISTYTKYINTLHIILHTNVYIFIYYKSVQNYKPSNIYLKDIVISTHSNFNLYQ